MTARNHTYRTSRYPFVLITPHFHWSTRDTTLCGRAQLGRHAHRTIIFTKRLGSVYRVGFFVLQKGTDAKCLSCTGETHPFRAVGIRLNGKLRSPLYAFLVLLRPFEVPSSPLLGEVALSARVGRSNL